MPLPTASSSAASSSGSARPAARRIGSSSNSGPATAASSSRSVVLGARRESRWLTTSRTLSGVPSSLSGRVTLTRPPRDLDDPRLDQGAPELADEEGVAAGEVVDRGRELAQLGVGVAAGGAADQVGDLGPGEPREAHPHDVLGAAQVGERLRELHRQVGLGVAEGHEEQQPGAPGGARQVPQQQQRRRVGPVPVLEHEQHRPPRLTFASRSATAVWRRWRSVSGSASTGSGSSPTRAGRSGSSRVSSPPPAPSAARSSVGLGHPHQAIERLDEGSVGRPHHRVAGAVEDERPVGCGLGRRTRAPGGSCRRPARRRAARRGAPRRRPAASGVRSFSSSAARPTNGEVEVGRSEPGRSGISASMEKTIVSLDHSAWNPTAVRSARNWVRSGHDRGLRAP